MTVAEQGFTLVELMIVLVILALASAAVIVALPDPNGRVTDDAERFAARVIAARDNAILQGVPMSVVVSASGYGFARRAGGQWQALADPPFAATEWKSGASAVVGPTGQQRVTFDGTGGAAEPLTVVLVRNEVRETVRVTPAGKVTVGG